jgi:murein DD-endopeptidase MepM/ murein hydrolase activator NlpD
LTEPDENWRAKALRLSTRHHRAIVASAVVLLAGTGVTAFGIAPMMPDAATLPQKLIVEAIATPGIEAQIEALSAVDLPLRRGTVTRASDTAEAILARLGMADEAAASFIRRDPVARRLLQGRSKLVQATSSSDGASLQQLVARFAPDNSDQVSTHFNRLTVERAGSSWRSRVELAELAATTRLGSGSIRSSLFAATDDAGLPDAVATQLAEIFSTDIDFHRELRKGDTFSVVYEALTADGEPVPWNDGTGKVLAAEFVNQGRVHQAVWFANDKSRGGYFDFGGKSKRRAFLASPMEFSRVTSGFALRFHPIQQTWRAHLGVDYGAPTGTPVRSVGDGTVEFSGRQNGYGNVVVVQHGNERSTLYAHLNSIDVKKGQRVEQGQRVGAVGTTGWSTGPHLHFEFRIHGQHEDPLRVAKASENVPLDPSAREQFSAVAKIVQSKLDVAETLLGVRRQSE